MKALLAALFLLLSAGAAPAADSPSLSGTWQVHSNIAGYESDAVCTLVQKDAALTGNCNAGDGAHDLTGTVDQKKVTWSYKSSYNGSPITIAYEGTLESPSKITGSVSVAEYGASGDFAATQSSSQP
jgi:hypothetical protein